MNNQLLKESTKQYYTRQKIKDTYVILVVDDQLQNIELLEAYLLPYGYELITAVSGSEAIEKLSVNRIDLILLDVMMSGMNGFEVTRRIRDDERHRLLPIILVTALRETQDRVRGIEAGCDDFISKPVDKIELLARVSSLLKVKAYNDLLSNFRDELESEVIKRTEELAELNFNLEKIVIERTAGLNQCLLDQSELNILLRKTTDELEKDKQKIQEMNESLSKKSIELEYEKGMLKDRNEIMETDLDMARNIQNCFIPSKPPVSSISFQYKPMDKVGGDFFDFFRFPDNDTIGIFISDVSGHGVQAAFITAMIKSSVFQISSDNISPSTVLKNLNDILIDHTSYNFVTAFYGYFKPDTREFTYSNAGHNAPYIITNDEIKYLNIKSKAMPLAILNNIELTELNKIYIDETVVLEKGSKLILYTDGFTETINNKFRKDRNYKDFENEMLMKSFRTHFNKPADLFINGTYHDLVNFRGCDDFEDDVCIICMDVE